MVDTIDVMGLDEIEVENTAIDDINSEVVNLIFVAIDQSGSMGSYVADMKKSLTNFKTALEGSKEVDEMLVARANFNMYKNDIMVGGYKKITEFDTNYRTSGMTPLYDVVIEGAEKLNNYMTYLKDQGMRVKAVFAVFSDGEDTSSQASISEARNAIVDLNNKEVTTAFISFGSEAITEAEKLQFKNKLQVGSTESELRKAFDCLSKSVIESSKSVVGNQDNFFTM